MLQAQTSGALSWQSLGWGGGKQRKDAQDGLIGQNETPAQAMGPGLNVWEVLADA